MGIGAVLLAAAAAVNPFTLGVAAGEVAVTSATLTVTPKDASGRIVNDITGQPCTPVVIQAR
jgi:hypothetical protein